MKRKIQQGQIVQVVVPGQPTVVPKHNVRSINSEVLTGRIITNSGVFLGVYPYNMKSQH